MEPMDQLSTQGVKLKVHNDILPMCSGKLSEASVKAMIEYLGTEINKKN